MKDEEIFNEWIEGMEDKEFMDDYYRFSDKWLDNADDYEYTSRFDMNIIKEYLDTIGTSRNIVRITKNGKLDKRYKCNKDNID